MPRYVRVNTVKMTVEEGEAALRAHVKEFLLKQRRRRSTSSNNNDSSEEKEKEDEDDKDNDINGAVSRSAYDCVYRDAHIPNLLCVEPWRATTGNSTSGGNLEFHSLDAVQEGRLILQDKASRFSAECAGEDSASAAATSSTPAPPRNKTTHPRPSSHRPRPRPRPRLRPRASACSPSTATSSGVARVRQRGLHGANTAGDDGMQCSSPLRRRGRSGSSSSSSKRRSHRTIGIELAD